MTPPQVSSPRELGEALRRVRLEADVTLEQISDHTKIGRRQLESLEAGEYGRLPDRVFVRMFLRQYLETIGQDPDEWLPAFDVAWERHARGSQSFVVQAPAAAVRPHRTGPWVAGFIVVAAAVAVLVWFQRRPPHGATPATLPSPTEVAAALVPTAAATPAPTVAPAPTPAADLVIETADDACWAEVRLDDGSTRQRLLPPHARWEVDTGGLGADLTLGNAGAAIVSFRGRAEGPLGRPGEVVHARVGPQPRAAGGAGA